MLALKTYNNLASRPDSHKFPVKGYLNELYNQMVYISMQRDYTQKANRIAEKWPPLLAKIEAL